MAKHAAAKPAVPVEHKVIQPTAVSAVLGVVLAILNGLAAGPGILDALAIPKVYQSLIIAVVPSLVVLVSGYIAPHTTRPDVDTETLRPMEDSNLVAPTGPVLPAKLAQRLADEDDDVPTPGCCGH